MPMRAMWYLRRKVAKEVGCNELIRHVPMPSNTYTAMPKKTGRVPTFTCVSVWCVTPMLQ